MKKLSLTLLTSLLLAAALLYCTSPTEPVFDNPYDEESGAYIPTPDLNTAPVHTVQATSARSGGFFESDFGRPVTQKGVCWSTSENPTIEDTCTNDGEGLGSFTSNLSGLFPGERHYVRAYATNDDGTIYGGQRSFTTLSGVPELQTGQADEIRALSAVARATLGEENGAVVLDWGLCYRPAQSPEEETCLSAVQQQLLAGGALREAGDLFAARAASQRLAQAAGRQSRSLSAEAGRPQPSAGPASENLQSGLTAEREQLQQRQPVAVQQRQTPAREQSSDHLPARLQNRDLPALQQQNELSGQAEGGPAAEILNTADGSFTVQLTNLQADTGYELRAWAVNDAVGVSYGNVVSFTTMDGVPEIESQPAASVTAFSASVESIIEKDGGDPITARGTCYGVMPNPDRSDNCIAAGQGLGSFEITLEELNADTQYFVRAYAENRVGVHFGNQISFATNDGLPGITTNPASEIRAFSAITGGTIQPDGEAPVTGRGVCYATTQNPTIDDSCVSAGQGAGSFSVTLGELLHDTQYFLRAYSLSAAGVGYGNTVSFITMNGVPGIQSQSAESVTAFSASVRTVIDSDGGDAITLRGICYSASADSDQSPNCIESGQGTGVFDVTIENLTPDTSYFVRAFAENGVARHFGNQISFNTNDGLPGITTTPATEITAFTARTGGVINTDGEAPVIERGVCVSTAENPTLEDTCFSSGVGEGSFTVILEGLMYDTQYHIRSFAQSETSVGYGNQETFITRNGIAELTTNAVSNILAFSAVVGGEITDDGGAQITARGACYATSENPSLEDTCVSAGLGLGSFEVSFSELNPDTEYFVRAYAQNDVGLYFGAQVNFTTNDGLPGITTTPASEIRAFSVLTGGVIEADGEAPVTERGVCYAATETPTLNDTCIAAGEGIGTFSVIIEGLTPDSQYFARAYSVSAAGVAYGNDEGFTTRDGVADVTTTIATNISAVTAISGGEITDDGGAQITARGLCYATMQNPTLQDICISGGEGLGNFSLSIVDLVHDTEFFVRAYSQSDAGVTYGNQISFITRDGIATLTTTEASDILAFSAVTGGEIIDDGGAPLIERGVCYSIFQNPTQDDTCVAAEESVVSYFVTLSDLTPNMNYFIRAYAENQISTFWGNQESFTTRDGIPIIMTREPFDIGYTTVKTGGEIYDNGGTEITEKGVCYVQGVGIPDLNSSCVNDGLSENYFDVEIDNLTRGEIYTVRAYASNSIITAWGDLFEFTTSDWLVDTVTVVSNVFNPATGRTWMDRNLGAARVAMASNDQGGYGHLYQWGRHADGHQYWHTGTFNGLSDTDQPGHSWFIRTSNAPWDWRNPKNDGFWQGVNGINNPCPENYRIPTVAEWEEEMATWSTNNAAGAFASPLKLTVGGRRSNTGSHFDAGQSGRYWAADIAESSVYVVHFLNTAGLSHTSRATAASVRCIQD
ncbi:MAG: hypothetical protein LAT75_14725 [Candidatus Cyclonatronum sp.]|uniref:FISUMP domain-containing protein n=1 Tax=Cyclonatronum sp. TaxID=3024185 RepID=UPI0025BA4878|nr:FISUMP domain-containing protein [Cyclonatronum sp.]MCH8488115.1 hypothetical protein [Cyclonatronum sp.]